MSTQQRIPVLFTSDQSATTLGVIGEGYNDFVAYSPFGYQRCSDNWVWPGLNGQRLERPLQIYLLGHGYRAYRSALNRFDSPDDLSPFGEGGLNAYAYCKSDPINMTDPSGHAGVATLLKRFRSPKRPKPSKTLHPTLMPDPAPKVRIITARADTDRPWRRILGSEENVSPAIYNPQNFPWRSTYGNGTHAPVTTLNLNRPWLSTSGNGTHTPVTTLNLNRPWRSTSGNGTHAPVTTLKPNRPWNTSPQRSPSTTTSSNTGENLPWTSSSATKTIRER
ncbi:RHS repeat-associated core domain-containing protein [Pseudomonas sp. MWU16-30317]|uniref:RHS repeat-associated core domain-containing protein n=1 Tax=Pseudomonas sp. MWU16-30317 TaxID=2878095 RepID=UPI001CF9E358|nr:RHS repeat-associated core domain-containing protein [Pseudomonas sp. MWU16-30317]